MLSDGIPVIDIHNHVGSADDGGSITLGKLRAAMRGAGVDKYVICPINDDTDYDPCYRRDNETIAQAMRRHPEIIGFGRVSPTLCPNPLGVVRRIAELGLRGIKLHVFSDKFEIQDAVPVLKLCAELGLAALCHTEHDCFRENARHWEAAIAESGAAMIIAHGGKDGYRGVARIVPKYDNAFVDTTCASYNRTRVLYNELGPRKLLFGSDMPYSHPLVEIQKWRLVATKRDLKYIFYKNAAAIFGIQSLK